MDAWRNYVHFNAQGSSRQSRPILFKSQSVLLGQRPIEIDNSLISDEMDESKLKQGIVYMKDFEFIPCEAWKLLREWYGGGPEFVREALHSEGSVIVELYPVSLSMKEKPVLLAKESFIVGDTVELKRNGVWLPCEIGQNTEAGYTLTEVGNQNSYVLLKDERDKMRKPRKIRATEGARGLRNLRNSCYMNTVIQCISHTPLLSEYFASKAFVRDINTNSKRNGVISRELGTVLACLRGKLSGPYSPISFKREFGLLRSDFQGSCQQDSHEFLTLLFGLLHEDLNRKTGPTTNCHETITLDNPDKQEESAVSKEQWRQIQGNIGSVISDFFSGQTKTNLQCEGCGHRQIVFETFMDLSLPIPVTPAENTLKLTFIPNMRAAHKEFKLTITKDSGIENVLSAVTQHTGTSPKNLLFSFVSSHRIAALITDTTELSDLLPGNSRELYVYEVLSTIEEGELEGKPTLKRPTDAQWRADLAAGQTIDVFCKDQWHTGTIEQRSDDEVLVRVYTGKGQRITAHVHSDAIAPFREHTVNEDEILYIPLHMTMMAKMRFGTPLILSIGNWYTLKDLYKRVRELCRIYTPQLGTKELDSIICVQLKQSEGVCAFCQEECPGCEFPQNSLKALAPFQRLSISVKWSTSVHYQKSRPEQVKDPESLDLYQCLAEYTRRESIRRECPNCEHLAISSQTEIWKVPDILVLHLKRFYFSKGGLKKIKHSIQFPLKDLELSSWMAPFDSKKGFTVGSTAENYRYELFAVVNHSGSATNGHYTAYCVSDKGWLEFNDDLVYKLTDEAAIATPAAYILFYKRKRFMSNNIINLSLN